MRLLLLRVQGVFTLALRLLGLMQRLATLVLSLTTLGLLRGHRGPLRLLPDKSFAPTQSALAGMKTVYILRHGESQWNVAQKNRDPVGMFGKFDHALTAVGVAQAEALRSRVRAVPRNSDERLDFDAATVIYCSPLTRAVQTALVALAAHPALRRHTGIILAPECRELTYPVGGFDSIKGEDGRTVAAKVLRRARKVVDGRSLIPIERGIARIDASELAAKDDWFGFETRRDASKRLRTFVERLKTIPDTTIIVVGHSLFFQALVANFADAASKRRDPTLKFLAHHKLKNAAIAKLALNCSEPHHPIVAATLVFTEEEESNE